MDIWSFSLLLLLFDTQFAGEYLGKKSLFLDSGVFKIVVVL